MYQTIYDETGVSGIAARCEALIDRCAPRMMVAGGGGLPGLWRETLTAETKTAIMAEWIAAERARVEGVGSRQIMEAIAEKHRVHYQTVCRLTRDLRANPQGLTDAENKPTKPTR